MICTPLCILLLLGWWFVSSEDAQGWVPATCLEAQTQDDPDEFTFPGGEGKLPIFQWNLLCDCIVAVVTH